MAIGSHGAADDETGLHTQRVGRLAEIIARNLGLPDYRVNMLGQAAPLHDVGKTGIPDAILLKPGALMPEEAAAMRAHTVIGARIGESIINN